MLGKMKILFLILMFNFNIFYSSEIEIIDSKFDETLDYIEFKFKNLIVTISKTGEQITGFVQDLSKKNIIFLDYENAKKLYELIKKNNKNH